MKQVLFGSLLVLASVFTGSVFALDLDLSDAAIVQKSVQQIQLSGVKVGDLKAEVAATFAWDADTSSLVLKSIDQDPATSNIPLGTWDLQFDWGCHGRATSTPLALYANGTFKTTSEGYTGKWTYDNKQSQIRWVYDQYPNTVYTGKYDGKAEADGTMTDGGTSGCFKMYFAHSSSFSPGFMTHESAKPE